MALRGWMAVFGALWLGSVGLAAQPEPPEPEEVPPEEEVAERLQRRQEELENQLERLREEWERWRAVGGEMDVMVIPVVPELEQMGEGLLRTLVMVGRVLPFPLGEDRAVLLGPRPTIAALRRALSEAMPEVAPAAVEWDVRLYVLADDLDPPQGDPMATTLTRETGFRGAQLLCAPRLHGQEGEESLLRFEGGGEEGGHLGLQLRLTPRLTAAERVECRVSLEMGLEDLPPGRYRHIEMTTTLTTASGQAIWLTLPDALTRSAVALVLTPTVQRK